MLYFLYGFMARDSGGKDVFVQSPRLTDRASPLDEGQAVFVDFVEGRKGLEAARVRLV